MIGKFDVGAFRKSPKSIASVHNECKGQEDVPTRLEVDEANI